MPDQYFAIPPFLFRAASEQSRGINTKDSINPLQGYDAKYHDNLEELEAQPGRAKWMLSNHIANQYKVPSEFSSWSASLLYGK